MFLKKIQNCTVPDKVVCLSSPFNGFDCFPSLYLFMGPLGVSRLVFRSKNNFLQLGKFFFSTISNGVKNFISIFNSALVGCLKFFVCEIFIVGKGFRFSRVYNSKKQVKGFRLFLGLRSIFRFLMPVNSIFIGLNKRKLVILSKVAQHLHNFAQRVQSVKIPVKFYKQGLFLRYKVRKSQNFRHKKRK